MNNWIETELSNIIELTNGYAFKSKDFKDTGIPVIKIKNVKPQEIKLDVLSYVDKETIIGKEKWKINKGDILITMSGNRSDGSPDSWVGKVAQFNKEGDYYLNQRLSILKPKVNYVNSTFLAYYLSSWDIQLELINLSNSSGGQANISPEIVKQLKVLLPTLQEQECIAEVLSCLDDKIELLHSNNKTLEQLAQILFRQLFEIEVQDSWITDKLENYVTIKRGGSPRPIQDFLSETGLRWLKISDASSLKTPFILNIKEFIKPEGLKKTVLLKAGSLVLSNSATPGIPKILAIDSCIHDGWLYFPKSNFSNEFLYLLFLKIRPELLQLGNGSIFTNLKTDILKKYPIVIPDQSTLENFDKTVKPFFEKMFINTKQIQQLETLRDKLLPKLISGSVRVEN